MSSTEKPWWRRWFGSRSERLAARFLRRQGYRILARNFSCQFGEIDIIALDGANIVFVEVRSTEDGTPEKTAASVDQRKQQKLTRLALYYLQKKRLLNQSARFDVLTVRWPAEQREPTIHHFANAFEATGKFQFFT